MLQGDAILTLEGGSDRINERISNEPDKHGQLCNVLELKSENALFFNGFFFPKQPNT